MTKRWRVVIIQPYVPSYRVPFFDLLNSKLESLGILLTVVAGSPDRHMRDRGDAILGPWQVTSNERVWTMGSHTLRWRKLGSEVEDARLIICEQTRTALELYSLLLRYPRRVPIALWGHGYIAARRSTNVGQVWMNLLTNRADWFFSYTPGGAEYLAAHGFERNRITVVNNSTDTATIRALVKDVHPSKVDTLRENFGLTPGHTAITVGGIDSSKRPDFLIMAADKIREQDTKFSLLVVGDGQLRHVIDDAAASRPWLHSLGRHVGSDLASWLACSDICLMPGRVGLVVTDMAAAGIPIVTTSWREHSVELEYLEKGISSLIAEDDPEDLAAQVVGLLRQPLLLNVLKQGATELGYKFSIEDMTDRFVDGVRSAVG